MENADAWVVGELTDLHFEPYSNLLPKISESFSKLHKIELQFIEKLSESVTKRQAVAFGLLARSYQLGISCLVNQLLQNFVGWNCSYRSLLETFFVIDWIEQDSQRFEAYFENTTPVIGRIKNECCKRYPQFIDEYDSASEVTHVGSRALHLPRKLKIKTSDEFPFAATLMAVAGPELTEMMQKFKELIKLLEKRLEVLLIKNFILTNKGEVIWKIGVTKLKFGCLGWQPKFDEKS